MYSGQNRLLLLRMVLHSLAVSICVTRGPVPTIRPAYDAKAAGGLITLTATLLHYFCVLCSVDERQVTSNLFTLSAPAHALVVLIAKFIQWTRCATRSPHTLMLIRNSLWQTSCDTVVLHLSSTFLRRSSPSYLLVDSTTFSLLFSLPREKVLAHGLGRVATNICKLTSQAALLLLLLLLLLCLKPFRIHW